MLQRFGRIVLPVAMLTLVACAPKVVDPMAACLPGVDPTQLGVTVTRFIYQPQSRDLSLEGCFPSYRGLTSTGVIRLVNSDGRMLREDYVPAPVGRQVEWLENSVVYRSEGVRVEWVLPSLKLERAKEAVEKKQEQKKGGKRPSEKAAENDGANS